MKCAKSRRASTCWTQAERPRAFRVVGQTLVGMLVAVSCQAPSSLGGGHVQSAARAEHELRRPVVNVPAPPSIGEPLATAAPQPAGAPDPLLGDLLASCGPGDRTLHRAAAKLLTHPLVQHPLDGQSLTFAVRTSGGPHVKPRGLRLHHAVSAEPAMFADQVAQWLSTLEPSPERRCGIASSTQSESGYWLGIVAADARADLEPLPTRVEPGTRLDFIARLLVPGTQTTLLVLGPAGPPREFLASLVGDRIEASFFLDAPGLHRIQLMVDDAGGPGAAVEAWVGVGQALPTSIDAGAAPGEAVRSEAREPEQAVLDMLNAARASEGLPAVKAHPTLAQLARRHATAMRKNGRLEHDLGDGNPRWRLEAGGVNAAAAGENVARAPTLARAHRAIWASPSHRANLLNPHFDKVGIGVERSQSGEWWVCELLADLR